MKHKLLLFLVTLFVGFGLQWYYWGDVKKWFHVFGLTMMCVLLYTTFTCDAFLCAIPLINVADGIRGQLTFPKQC